MRLNQVSYSSVYLALTLIALPSIFSGCDFGNKSKTELTGYDTISGYYISLPQAISFRAKVGANEISKNGTMTQMPDFLKLVMANPTLLYFDDPIEGIGSIRSRTSSGVGIPTRIEDKVGTFGVSVAAHAEVTGCTLVQEISNNGTFSQLAETVIVSNVKARGKIALTYSIDYRLVGEDADCNPLRARFQSCYTDGTNCATDAGSIFAYDFVTEMFDPAVHSGLIAPSDIGTIRTIGYTARYE